MFKNSVLLSLARSVVLFVSASLLLVYRIISVESKSVTALFIDLFFIMAVLLLINSLRIVFPVTIQFLKKDVSIERLIHSYELRKRIILISSAMMNVSVFTFYLLIGIYYRSLWFISIAVYYMFIGGTRLFLYIRRRNQLCISEPQHAKDYGKKSVFICGIFLQIINLIIGLIGVLVIYNNNSYHYHWIFTYIIGVYLIIRMMVIVSYIRKPRKEEEIWRAVRLLGVVSVLVSVFTFQTAMLDSYSVPLEATKMYNTITGSFVFIALFGIGLRMIIYGNEKYKNIP